MAESLNIPAGQPYGDIFQVQTPTLDRVGQQLQQQQIARQQYAQKESQQMDSLVGKELAKARSTDMPDIIDAYTKWKGLRQKTLFDRNLQADPKAYNAAQIESNVALGNLQQLINGSAEINNLQKGLVADRKTKPNLFSDDFGNRISILASTPLSKLKNYKIGDETVDLTNPDSYRYKGTQTDFGGLVSKAADKPQEMFTREDQIDSLQRKYTPVLMRNNPLKVFDTLKGNYGQRISNRDAAAAWESIPQEEKDSVRRQFDAIPESKWKAWKLEGKPNISPANPNDPAENFAAYQAMKYAINEQPSEGKAIVRTNKEAELNARFNQQKLMEGIRQGNRIQLKEVAHTFKQMDKTQQDSKLDEFYSDLMNKTKEGSPVYYKSADGKIRKQYDIPVSPFIKSAFALPNDKGHKLPPDQIRTEENGDLLLIYYQRGEDNEGNPIIKKEGGSYAVDPEKSRRITSSEFKAVIGKTLMGIKEANAASNDVDGKGAGSPSNPAPSAPPVSNKKSIPGF